MQKGRFCSIICHAFKLLNRICRFKSLKPCRRVSVDLNLKRVAVFPLQHHNEWSHTSRYYKIHMDWSYLTTTQPRHCSHRFQPLLRHQRYKSSENMWEWWRGFSRNKVAASTKFEHVQERLDTLVFFLLSDSPASGFYVPTFRNTGCSIFSVMKRRHIKSRRRESPISKNTTFRTRWKFLAGTKLLYFTETVYKTWVCKTSVKLSYKCAHRTIL
jgi:hypothetical protein